MRVGAVIAAAGRGTRLGAAGPKVLLPLCGIPIVVRATLPFQRSPWVHEIVVVACEEALEDVRRCVGRYGLSKVRSVVTGGPERQDSVGLGLAALGACDVVLVHDGARPLVDESLIEDVVRAASEFGAAVPAIPVRDTLKRVDDDRVTETVSRTGLWAAQTPQGFRSALLRSAHARARSDGVRGTDDAFLVERLGHPVRVIPGRVHNLKVTTPEDLAVAEALVRWLER